MTKNIIFKSSSHIWWLACRQVSFLSICFMSIFFVNKKIELILKWLVRNYSSHIKVKYRCVSGKFQIVSTHNSRVYYLYIDDIKNSNTYDILPACYMFTLSLILNELDACVTLVDFDVTYLHWKPLPMLLYNLAFKRVATSLWLYNLAFKPVFFHVYSCKCITFNPVATF